MITQENVIYSRNEITAIYNTNKQINMFLDGLNLQKGNKQVHTRTKKISKTQKKTMIKMRTCEYQKNEKKNITAIDA